MDIRRISIIMPVYNEERFIARALDRVKGADLGFSGLSKEIIVVNDGSSDGTVHALEQFRDSITLIDLERNHGKGHAIKAGLGRAHGEVVIIQDADLEYDPADYRELLRPIIEGRADIVYGSRFIGGQPHRVLLFWHYAVNRLLTLLANIMANLNLSDMETGYKVFRTAALRSVRLRERRFGFEPEVTIKLARKGWRFYEVGISYSGRTYAEGKKISWRDGLRALWVIIRYGISSWS